MYFSANILKLPWIVGLNIQSCNNLLSSSNLKAPYSAYTLALNKASSKQNICICLYGYRQIVMISTTAFCTNSNVEIVKEKL